MRFSRVLFIQLDQKARASRIFQFFVTHTQAQYSHPASHNDYVPVGTLTPRMLTIALRTPVFAYFMDFSHWQ